MKVKVIFATVAFALIIAVNLLNADGERAGTLDSMTKLRSANKAERFEAALSLLRERRKTVEELQKIITENIKAAENTNDENIKQVRWETARTSIWSLGKMRAVEAVPLLVENLTFLVLDPLRGGQPIEEKLPSVGALIEIGTPSLEPVLQRVEGLDVQDRRVTEYVARCAATVIRGVLDRKVAIAYVEDHIEQQNDPVRQQRLMRLRQLVDNDLQQIFRSD